MTDLEPSEEWKANLKKRIEGELAPMVKDAKDQLETSIRHTHEDSNRLLAEHQSALNKIRILAEEQFWKELGRERLERREAARMSLGTNWVESLREEQEVIYQQIKQSEKGPVPNEAPSASSSSSQQVPKPSSQRWGPGPQASAQPLSSSPRDRRDLQQESMRRKAEHQRPPLPTWTSTGQAAKPPPPARTPIPRTYEIPPLHPNLPLPFRSSTSASSSSTQRARKSSSQGSGSEPPAPAQPPGASSPHDRHDLQQESLRRKAEQQRPSFPYRTSAGQTADASSISKSPPPARKPWLPERTTPFPHRPPSETPAPPSSIASSGSSLPRPIDHPVPPPLSYNQMARAPSGGGGGGNRQQNRETVPAETFEQSLEKEKKRQKKRIAEEEKEREERECERLERDRDRARLERDWERLNRDRELLEQEMREKVARDREKEREKEKQLELERHLEKERELVRLERERERVRQLKREREEREAREREDERKNKETEKMLQELKEAREKAEEALRLAQEAAESKLIAEEQAEELKRRREEADKLARAAFAKHREAESQHNQALELQKCARLKEESTQRKLLDILRKEKELAEKESQLQKLELKCQEEQMKSGEEVRMKKEEAERLDEELEKKKHELEGLKQRQAELKAPRKEQEEELKAAKEVYAEVPGGEKALHQFEEASKSDEGRQERPMHIQLTEEEYVRSALELEGNKNREGAQLQVECKERDGEVQAVPAPELVKNWKASLKLRIDQEIGILIQLNTQWFEENLAKVKEDNQPRLKTELENITHSLDVLRKLSLDMFSGEVAEMVILVERESTEEGKVANIDTAADDRGEFEASAASPAQVPGPKEEPQVIEPGRREEEAPEIEPGKDAEEPAKEDESNDATAATQLEKLKDAFTPRRQSTGQGPGMSSFANAHHFVIHHATFINSEAAHFSTPTHGMWNFGACPPQSSSETDYFFFRT
ncbi:hypothetical protein H1R20_g443, partial [Candolleomyces eurysporus]